jgi:soluble lytic murein transglycosylase-like protein
MRRGLISVALMIASAHACAGMDACFAHAAARRHININLLYAIGQVESDYVPEATNKKTHAIGVMQILPWHLTWLARYGITEPDLYDACTNINVGAFVLADFIRMYGNTWRAVGAYGAGVGAGKEAARTSYAQLVEVAYEKIARGGAPSTVAVQRVSAKGQSTRRSGQTATRPMMVED